LQPAGIDEQAATEGRFETAAQQRLQPALHPLSTGNEGCRRGARVVAAELGDGPVGSLERPLARGRLAMRDGWVVDHALR
jgi:hypothetical protein